MIVVVRFETYHKYHSWTVKKMIFLKFQPIYNLVSLEWIFKQNFWTHETLRIPLKDTSTLWEKMMKRRGSICQHLECTQERNKSTNAQCPVAFQVFNFRRILIEQIFWILVYKGLRLWSSASKTSCHSSEQHQPTLIYPIMKVNRLIGWFLKNHHNQS